MFITSMFYYGRSFYTEIIDILRMFVAFNIVFLKSQEFGCYISTVIFRHIPVISGLESV